MLEVEGFVLSHSRGALASLLDLNLAYNLQLDREESKLFGHPLNKWPS